MKNEIQQASLEGDEEIINQLYGHLVEKFPKLHFEKKVLLKELFPEPESRWLRGFWNHGSHADIAVSRHGKLVCIVEPGGGHHFKEEQKIRDQKKDRLCRDNQVNCLRTMNSVVNHLDKVQTRRLFKKYFYKEARNG